MNPEDTFRILLSKKRWPQKDSKTCLLKKHQSLMLGKHHQRKNSVVRFWIEALPDLATQACSMLLRLSWMGPESPSLLAEGARPSKDP